MDEIDAILGRVGGVAPRGTTGAASPGAPSDEIDAILGRSSAPGPRSKSFDEILAERGAPAAEKPRTFRNTGRYEDLQAEIQHQKDELQPKDITRRESIGQGLIQGATLGFSDEGAAALAAGVSKLPPSVRAFMGRIALERHAGVSPELARAIAEAGSTQPLDYTTVRDDIRAYQDRAFRAHPGATTIANFVGGLPTTGLGAAKGTGVGAAAATGLKQGALAGAGYSNADLARGDVGGFARDVAVSAGAGAALGAGIRKAVGGAPERVTARVVKDVVEGDAGAKLSTAKKVVAAAGEDGAELATVLERHPGLERAVAVSAKNRPGAVAKAVEVKIGRLSKDADALYARMDDAAANARRAGAEDKAAGMLARAGEDGRSTRSAAAFRRGAGKLEDGVRTGKAGSVNLQAIDDQLASLHEGFARDGKAIMAAAVEAARDRLTKTYGTDGIIGPEARLTGRAARNLANEIGEAAFGHDPTASPKMRARAMQAVYRAVTGAIEDAAAAAGQDVAKLKLINKDISTLLPVKRALEERASKEAAGRVTWAERAKQELTKGAAGIAGIGSFAASGDPVKGAAVAAGVAAGRAALKHGVAPAVRLADYQLASIVKAARAGSTKAQLTQLAIEFGLTRVAADQLARQLAPDSIE